MSTPRLIPHVDASSPLFVPTTPDFAGFAAQQLGDLGSSSDGFDAIFAGPASIIDADAASVAALDPAIAAADFEEGTFAAAYHAPVDGELPAFLKDGEALNAAVQDPGQVTGSPVITPPASPPSGGAGGAGDGGGGGGGGGNGGGSGDGCIEGDEYPWCNNNFL